METRLSAFDWEHGIADGFPYLDLAYFILQVAALIYSLAAGEERDLCHVMARSAAELWSHRTRGPSSGAAFHVRRLLPDRG